MLPARLKSGLLSPNPGPLPEYFMGSHALDQGLATFFCEYLILNILSLAGLPVSAAITELCYYSTKKRPTVLCQCYISKWAQLRSKETLFMDMDT